MATNTVTKKPPPPARSKLKTPAATPPPPPPPAATRKITLDSKTAADLTTVSLAGAGPAPKPTTPTPTSEKLTTLTPTSMKLGSTDAVLLADTGSTTPGTSRPTSTIRPDGDVIVDPKKISTSLATDDGKLNTTQHFQTIPGASVAAQDFLNDSAILGKYDALKTYKQNIAINFSSASASLSAQDLSGIDAATTDVGKYNEQPITFLNEVQHDDESVNRFLTNANTNTTAATGVMDELRAEATKRGLDYDKDITPYVAQSSAGASLRGAEENLGQQKVVLDMETIKYANKLTDKATQYLAGYDVVKGNQKLDMINQLVSGLTSLVTNTIWGGSGLLKGGGMIAGAIRGAANVEKLTAGEGADIIAMFQTYANTAWKGSPINAPALKALAGPSIPGSVAGLDAYSAARDSDVSNAVTGMKSKLDELLTKAKATQDELNTPPDDNSGWFIPGV